MSILLVQTPEMIKSAGKITDALKAFHGAGMASWNKGTLRHAASKAKNFTEMAKNEQGFARATTPLNDVRNSAAPSFMERMRVKNVDKAVQARQNYSTHRSQANDAYNSAFGAPQGAVGRFGKKLFNGAAGMTYDIPRALTFHPASQTGLTGYVGVGLGAHALGVPDPYEYSLPDVVGKSLYSGTRAKTDIQEAAQAGAGDGVSKAIQDWKAQPFSQRWKTAFNPQLPGVSSNQYTSNPYGKAESSGLLRNGGGLNEGFIRQQVAQGVEGTASPYMNKSSGFRDVFRSATKGLSNGYKTLNPAVKTGLGYTGAVAFPAALGYGAYSGARDQTQATAYDQGYNSAQGKARQYYQNLPTWQRALAAVAPDAALKYGMSQMGRSKATPTPGYNDMGPDKPAGQPVTSMYTRPDGTEVF